MDVERAQRLAALAEAKKRRSEIELLADALITDLRLTTDPRLADDFLSQDIGRAAGIMARLEALWNEGRQVAQRIDKLREALGE